MGIRIAVLASGRGSNLLAIMQAITDGAIDGEIAVVLSDKEGAMALEHARKAGIPAYHVNPKAFADKSEYEAKLLEYIAQEYRQGKKQHRFPDGAFRKSILLGPQCGHLLSAN